jgi:Flp pilus assembly protein TadD
MNASIQLLKFNTEMHPDSWEALFELSKVYDENGDLLLAKTTALKAQQLDPENNEINKLLAKINEEDK